MKTRQGKRTPGRWQKTSMKRRCRIDPLNVNFIVRKFGEGERTKDGYGEYTGSYREGR